MITPRQLTVLTLWSQGYIGKEIADILKISLSTLEDHNRAIKKRFKARSLCHAIAIAYQNKIL